MQSVFEDYLILNSTHPLMHQLVKNPPAKQETPVQFLGCEGSPGGGHGNSLQYSSLGSPQGQRSLVGCSPWGRK